MTHIVWTMHVVFHPIIWGGEERVRNGFSRSSGGGTLS